jgi:hypothetical protein
MIAWPGRGWPGEQEAVQLGYTCLDSGKGYIPCTPDTPGAMPDLNRFLVDYEWMKLQNLAAQGRQGVIVHGSRETSECIRSRGEGDTCAGKHGMTGCRCGAWRQYGPSRS